LTPELVRLRAYLMAAVRDAGRNHPRRRRAHADRCGLRLES
jgi:hypothetical protein